MKKNFEYLNDPTGFLEAYAAYEAKSNYEIALDLWPVMETWSMARLAEDTGISRNTLSRYMKLSFLEDCNSSSLKSKPTYFNYMKIMSAGTGEKTPWIPRFDSYLETHQNATLQDMKEALHAPEYAVRRYELLYSERLSKQQPPEDRPISLAAEARDAAYASSELDGAHPFGQNRELNR